MLLCCHSAALNSLCLLWETIHFHHYIWFRSWWPTQSQLIDVKTLSFFSKEVENVLWEDHYQQAVTKGLKWCVKLWSPQKQYSLIRLLQSAALQSVLILYFSQVWRQKSSECWLWSSKHLKKNPKKIIIFMPRVTCEDFITLIASWRKRKVFTGLFHSTVQYTFSASISGG